MINLQNKRLVFASKHPPLFYAEPFEKVLDFLSHERVKRKQSLEEKKEELLSTWRSILDRKELHY